MKINKRYLKYSLLSAGLILFFAGAQWARSLPFPGDGDSRQAARISAGQMQQEAAAVPDRANRRERADTESMGLIQAAIMENMVPGGALKPLRKGIIPDASPSKFPADAFPGPFDDAFLRSLPAGTTVGLSDWDYLAPAAGSSPSNSWPGDGHAFAAIGHGGGGSPSVGSSGGASPSAGGGGGGGGGPVAENPDGSTPGDLSFVLPDDWPPQGFTPPTTDMPEGSGDGAAPVPEPATLLLLGAGLVVLVAGTAGKRQPKTQPGA